MLSAEAAQAALAERREQVGARGRARFTGPVARAASAIAEHHPDGAKLVAGVDRLGRRGRRLAFGALLPGLGGELSALFEDAGALTYQFSWDRRPFRAPKAPQHARQRVLVALPHATDELVAHAAEPVWLARWAGHLAAQSWRLNPQLVGWLLATAIDAGNDEVFDVLIATIDGSDDIATMGRHVPIALLCAAREEGWERVERLLLAAQREEGLRQSILEVVDEAHPVALRRMLGVILEHDLARFASVARAMSVWLGLEVFAGERRRIASLAGRCHAFLSDPRTVPGEDPLDAYLALWAAATTDVHTAIAHAAPLLDDPDPERRFAAVHFLTQTRVDSATPGLLHALRDDDLRVAATACFHLSFRDAGTLPESYDAIEALLARVPRKTRELEPVSWLGPLPALQRERVAALLLHHVDPPLLDRVLPHAKALDPWDRGKLVEQLAKTRPTDARRAALLAFLGDASPEVRSRAIDAATSMSLTDDEARALEPLLKRKPGDLRRGVLELIAGRGDALALAAAERLLAGDEQQRLGAVELLRRLAAGGSKLAGTARVRLEELGHGDEGAVADATRRAVRDEPLTRLDEGDGFGLFDAAELTAGLAPRRTGFQAATPAALRVIALLDELVDRNAGVEIVVDHWGSRERVLLGAADALGLPVHARRLRSGETDLELPLGALWPAFAAELPAGARDPDGQQILRAYLHCAATAQRVGWGERAKLASAIGVRYAPLVCDVLAFLAFEDPDAARLACALDAAEDRIARMSRRELAGHIAYWDSLGEVSLVRMLAAEPFADGCPELTARHWRLERWLSEPPGVTATGHPWGDERPRAGSRQPLRPPEETVALALARGVATEADVVDHLVGPRGPYWEFRALGRLSTPRARAQIAGADRLGTIVERVRERVVSIELARGEAPTAAASAVLALRRTGGLDVLVAALAALGKDSLVRGWVSDGEGRSAVFSHLVAASVPGDGDTPERFAVKLRGARVSDRRLREVACYAPQWARHVEATLQRQGLADAVWWLHAHTKDERWTTDEDLREDWARAVAERTVLTADELVDGAVDVAWFRAARERLGDDELDLLLAAAKYGSTSGGHKRAELFARAMRGDVTEDALVARIASRRHQDSLRAIGLLALPGAASERDTTIARRYEVLQAYRRESRQFGRQRQASEGRATEIGMENLARTAGFADPIRLTWAMEAHLTADLAGGGVTVEHEDVSVTLAVDGDGRPDVRVQRGDKDLKAVPAKLRKVPAIQALTVRTTELRRQASRIKASLEGAMVRGDAITGAELATFSDHVLLWPAITRLVLVADEAAGFPDRGGRALRDASGTEHAIGPGETLLVAHPVDLVDRDWPAWQRAVMGQRLVQPFKQVFRELYVPVDGERTEDGGSRRYAGHQVQPGRARALLAGRGWRLDDEEGGARRIDHHEHVVASLWFVDGFGSPLDVEPPTLEEVRFHDTREYAQVDVRDVAPRLFSEVMRDIDLVVSVAHVAGVDPEASQSSLEIRGALVTETCELLGLDNVAVDGPRVLIDGEIGRYAVHLGSAGVQRMPGGSVCIVPVGGQQRGRIFLPFADDDPKTAELVAKVLLLARDRDIRDPTILEQLRR